MTEELFNIYDSTNEQSSTKDAEENTVHLPPRKTFTLIIILFYSHAYSYFLTFIFDLSGLKSPYLVVLDCLV